MNMSYCRFRNTLEDLKDCLEALNSGEIELVEELRAARGLLEICQEICEFDEDDLDEMYHQNAVDDDDYEDNGDD